MKKLTIIIVAFVIFLQTTNAQTTYGDLLALEMQIKEKQCFVDSLIEDANKKIGQLDNTNISKEGDFLKSDISIDMLLIRIMIGSLVRYEKEFLDTYSEIPKPCPRCMELLVSSRENPHWALRCIDIYYDLESRAMTSDSLYTQKRN